MTNGFVVAIHASMVALSITNSHFAYSISIAGMIVLTTTVTLFAVCKIKNVIGQKKHAFPNERLIDVHWMVYLAYTILYTSSIAISSFSGIGFALQGANKLWKVTNIDEL